MAHLKKLQTEIDKGLKKVDEGVEEYNRLKDAHHRASQPNQKEKLEENLKAQIKKLQRDRNQLSSWIAEKSVKDKDLLMEGKSKIEALMDHFKDFERESKMKRFSQVGLNKEDRADPEVQKRREMITWIQDMLSNLEKEFDELTAEDQRLTSRKPSKNSKEEANLAFTKRVLESHRWHMNKLEQLQRKLNNEDVNVESLETLKDSLTNYMDEGINQRTAEGFMDFNEAYDDFNLEEVEDYLATGREKDDEEEKEEVKKEEPKPKEPAKHKAPSISVHPRPVDEKPKEKVASKQIATRVLAQPPAHQAPSQASHAMPSAVAAAAAPVASPAPSPHIPKQLTVAPPPPVQVPPQPRALIHI
jgi:CCR4-NOT transcription complex subunit 3